MKIHAAALAALLCLCACDRPAPAPQAPPAAKAATEPAAVERWLGRWNGPEGTWLSISPDGAGLRIEIADLDGPKTYSGRAVGERVEFERNGKTEAIRPGNGADTGMKWLADKKDCLLTAPGEGWCRD